MPSDRVWLYAHACCGIKEYHGLHTFFPKKQVDDEHAVVHLMRMVEADQIFVANNTVNIVATFDHQWLTKPFCAFFLFTDTNRAAGGHNLARYIKDHDLGSVTVTPPLKNPNSGNEVTVFLWGADHEKILAWYNVQKEEERRKRNETARTSK